MLLEGPRNRETSVLEPNEPGGERWEMRRAQEGPGVE